MTKEEIETDDRYYLSVFKLNGDAILERKEFTDLKGAMKAVEA